MARHLFLSRVQSEKYQLQVLSDAIGVLQLHLVRLHYLYINQVTYLELAKIIKVIF